MSIVIISKNPNAIEWRDQLEQLHPGVKVGIYPDDIDRENVDFAVVWYPPKGVYRHYPNLKCIASTGAGVDHILSDDSISEEISITRVVDKRLAKDMAAYLVSQVMSYLRGLTRYKLNEQTADWRRQPYKVPDKTNIGILGMGELGKVAARNFHELGFLVTGWSRKSKQIPNVQMFAGEDEFSSFLSQVDILICLLPLTNNTIGLLNINTFRQLPKGAYLINVARGKHLVEDDLIQGLAEGQLSGACLDVFREEPLPPDHPFWKHPDITVTPHIASITSVSNVAPQIIDNYRRMQAGTSLVNEVSREKGY